MVYLERIEQPIKFQYFYRMKTKRKVFNFCFSMVACYGCILESGSMIFTVIYLVLPR